MHPSDRGTATTQKLKRRLALPKVVSLLLQYTRLMSVQSSMCWVNIVLVRYSSVLIDPTDSIRRRVLLLEENLCWQGNDDGLRQTIRILFPCLIQCIVLLCVSRHDERACLYFVQHFTTYGQAR